MYLACKKNPPGTRKRLPEDSFDSGFALIAAERHLLSSRRPRR
jgi:hypothetical protein